MKVLVAGHRYELALFDPEDHVSRLRGQPQVLQFVHKEPIGPGRKEMRTLEPGTTNEEVIDMMIDRLEFLQERMPCEENEIAIRYLKAAWSMLVARTARRNAAKIEGLNVEETPAEAPKPELTGRFTPDGPIPGGIERWGAGAFIPGKPPGLSDPTAPMPSGAEIVSMLDACAAQQEAIDAQNAEATAPEPEKL